MLSTNYNSISKFRRIARKRKKCNGVNTNNKRVRDVPECKVMERYEELMQLLKGIK